MSADIDIDFADRDSILKLIQHVPARLETGRQHNSGVYVTDIPLDPILGCAALDYESAEQRGYFKLDFLNMSVYQLIKDPAHYQSMLAATPPWERLWTDREWARQLVHVGNYTDLLAHMKPDSIPRMAAFISIFRDLRHSYLLFVQVKHTYKHGPGQKCLRQFGTGMIHKATHSRRVTVFLMRL